MLLRFSTVQEKEMIEAGSGKFVGYIVDAEVNEHTGHIECFFVSRPRKFYQFIRGEEPIRRVAIEDVLIVGQDVILIKPSSG